MQSTIVIRPSRKEDFEQLVELDNMIWDTSTAPVPIHWSSVEEYESHCPAGSQLVAEVDGFIGGYLGFKAPTPLASNEHVSELNIAVHPSFQRMGIGRGLLDAAKLRLLGLGKKKLSLRVLATNESAITFYKQCGFQEQGRLVGEFHLNGQYVDDVLMYILLDDAK
jgi:ribosomal protein S18 acetylase RimI-like enzyme